MRPRQEVNSCIVPGFLILLLIAGGAAKAQHAPAPGLPPDPAPQASDLTAAQLMAKYQAARGGEQRLLGLQTVKMTGTWETSARTSHGSSSKEDPSPVTVLIAPGRYFRRIERASGVMIKVIDGQTAWEVNPRNGIHKPTPMDPQDAIRFRQTADPQGLLAKGNKIEVVGKLPWKSTQVYKLKVTFRDGSVGHVYLDARSFLPVRFVGSLYGVQTKTHLDMEVLYEDFRDVDGVKWPFTEKTNVPEARFTQTISWKSIEVNKKPFDEAAFKAPKS